MPRDSEERVSIATRAASACSASTPAARVGRACGDRLGQPQVHRQCHQVLLRAVVDVALQASPLDVLGLDEPLPGRLQLLGTVRPAPRAGSSSSARSPTSRSTRPAWAASPVNSRSSTAVSGRPGRSCSRSTPSAWPPWRTGRARRPSPVASRASGCGSGGSVASSAVRRPGGGQRQSARRRSATPAPTAAPVPFGEQPSPCAPAARSVACLRSWSPRSGSARRTAWRHRRARGWSASVRGAACTGANSSATVAVASTDRTQAGRVGAADERSAAQHDDDVDADRRSRPGRAPRQQPAAASRGRRRRATGAHAPQCAPVAQPREGRRPNHGVGLAVPRCAPGQPRLEPLASR